MAPGPDRRLAQGSWRQGWKAHPSSPAITPWAKYCHSHLRDSRLIEVYIHTRIEIASASVIEQEGRNKEFAAAHDLIIQQGKLEQDEVFSGWT